MGTRATCPRTTQGIGGWAMSKGTSLLAAAKGLAPRKPKTWLDALTKEQIAELNKLKAAYQAKELPTHITVRRLWTDVVKPAGIVVGKTAFTSWMGEK